MAAANINIKIHIISTFLQEQAATDNIILQVCLTLGGEAQLCLPYQNQTNWGV